MAFLCIYRFVALHNDSDQAQWSTRKKKTQTLEIETKIIINSAIFHSFFFFFVEKTNPSFGQRKKFLLDKPKEDLFPSLKREKQAEQQYRKVGCWENVQPRKVLFRIPWVNSPFSSRLLHFCGGWKLSSKYGN